MTFRFLKILTIAFLSALLSIVYSNCYYDNEEDLYPTNNNNTTTCDTVGVSFASFTSPLINSKCATSSCHNATARAGGISLANYTSIKNFITANRTLFFGSIKHQAGYSKMPLNAAKLPNCEISKLEAWVNKGMPNN